MNVEKQGIGIPPITSVKKLDAKRTIMVNVMKNIVGPFSVDPVTPANHLKTRFTKNKRNSAYATVQRRM